MVSYYLPIHFIALNAILKKIIGGVHMNFKLSDWSIFIGLLPKSNQVTFLIV